MTIEEIERLSMQYDEIPKGLSQPEQILFLSLRVLHYEYRHKTITLDRAKKEKGILIDTFKKEMQMHKIFEDHLRIRNQLSYKFSEATKNGCEICKDIVSVFDGIDLRKGNGHERS